MTVPNLPLNDPKRYEYYTPEKVAELHAAFEMVRNPENWKYPIDAILPFETSSATQMDVVEAIAFYCGSTALLTVVSTGYRVRANGYYADIGA